MGARHVYQEILKAYVAKAQWMSGTELPEEVLRGLLTRGSQMLLPAGSQLVHLAEVVIVPEFCLGYH
jgi:cystathionine beta-lyase family protein involved in aluminum resistance